MCPSKLNLYENSCNEILIHTIKFDIVGVALVALLELSPCCWVEFNLMPYTLAFQEIVMNQTHVLINSQITTINSQPRNQCCQWSPFPRSRRHVSSGTTSLETSASMRRTLAFGYHPFRSWVILDPATLYWIRDGVWTPKKRAQHDWNDRWTCWTDWNGFHDCGNVAIFCQCLYNRSVNDCDKNVLVLLAPCAWCLGLWVWSAAPWALGLQRLVLCALGFGS